MSGGLFPGYPFHFNIKCIIFTLFLSGGYWYLPKKNIFILFFLLWFPYILLAWYDYFYNCQDKMMPTLIPFGRYIFLPFKPPDYQNEYNKLPDNAIKSMDLIDHITLWTLFIIIIFFILKFIF
uniref:Uncharacterized protein n=1 Tax=viral metagenome TaxID=1070528 RepID=A0A6C0H7P6_9ZZZZ